MNVSWIQHSNSNTIGFNKYTFHNASFQQFLTSSVLVLNTPWIQPPPIQQPWIQQILYSTNLGFIFFGSTSLRYIYSNIQFTSLQLLKDTNPKFTTTLI